MELIVTIESARHLPKMDLMGTSDTFCEIEWQGQKYKTTVKKNSCSPDWNETFAFPVENISLGVLSVVVMDWDMVSKNDLVGEVVIPGDTLQAFWKVGEVVVPGDILKREVAVLNKGKAVIGNDNKPCVLNLKMRLAVKDEEEPPPVIQVTAIKQAQEVKRAAVTSISPPQLQFQTAHICSCSLGHQLSMMSAQMKWGCNMCQTRFTYNPRLRCNECDFDLCSTCGTGRTPLKQQHTSEVWKLRLGLIKAQHLPNKHFHSGHVSSALMGIPDPFVTFDIPGQQQQKSKAIINSVNPEWNEEFVFDVHDEMQELVLGVFDLDEVTRNDVMGDLIGEVRLKLSDLSSFLNTESGQSSSRGHWR